MNCIFCDIVNRLENAEILYEDNETMAFLDIRPFNHGHSLVIPKNHYSNFLEVSNEDLSAMMKLVQKLANSVKTSLNADGYNILSNNGIAAGQTIFHCHFHIIPRFNSDGFKFKMNLKEYEENEMREIAFKIKENLK
ncbi:MAG: HIT family protein [Ignavibacteria bacterium]|jgi:histidine triad (HIT) family protein|nr:HIT family protein [Ignavibacteria bacterium]MDP3831285.1 HIT family protein [Ignavibacteriaceae bacterium]